LPGTLNSMLNVTFPGLKYISLKNSDQTLEIGVGLM
jgi:hypothetical protein